MKKHYKIGTRGSPLALVQALIVRDQLCAHHGLEKNDFEIVPIKTSGDRLLGQSLNDIGGKGLFTKEIQAALLLKEIDIAVHSAKDMATQIAEGLQIPCYLPREDVRDVFISRDGTSLEDMPEGSYIGTASLRRQALIKHYYPHLQVKLLRGNVQTRLKKLKEGAIDGTLLAYSGLKRLGQTDVITEILELDHFLSPVGQGAIALEIREDDIQTASFIEGLNCVKTQKEVLCERAYLEILEGSCRMPIAGLAMIKNSHISLKALLIRPDGQDRQIVEKSANISDYIALGQNVGHALKHYVTSDFFKT